MVQGQGGGGLPSKMDPPAQRAQAPRSWRSSALLLPFPDGGARAPAAPQSRRVCAVDDSKKVFSSPELRLGRALRGILITEARHLGHLLLLPPGHRAELPHLGQDTWPCTL